MPTKGTTWAYALYIYVVNASNFSSVAIGNINLFEFLKLYINFTLHA